MPLKFLKVSCHKHKFLNQILPFKCKTTCKLIAGPVAHSVASSSADSGIVSSIPIQSHTFMHEIVSTVILLIPLIQEGLLSVTSNCIFMKYRLEKLAQEKVWLGYVD